MAENGLILNPGRIDLGSPSGLDDFPSAGTPFTVMLLLDPITLVTNDSLVAKLDASASTGWTFSYDSTIGACAMSIGRATNNTVYYSNTGMGLSSGTKSWIAAAVDVAAGATLKSAFFAKTWNAGSFTDLGVAVSHEGTGAIAADAANTLRIGYLEVLTQSIDAKIYAMGILSGKKSAAQLQTITDDMQGTTWLGLWGRPTLTSNFIKMAGTATAIADGTTSGSVTLDTGGPDWYTTAGGVVTGVVGNRQAGQLMQRNAVNRAANW